MPGLGVKAFLLREKGVDDSPVSQYAPFYIWADDDAAARFLWGGDQFTGVVEAYGRPVVQTWIGGGYYRGPGVGEVPTWAVRAVTPLPGDVAPAETASMTSDLLASRTAERGLHSATFGIDPRTWQLVVFSMHTERPRRNDGELYTIPHLSAPAANAL